MVTAPARASPLATRWLDDGKRGPHDYDAAEKVNGRKRHVLVDTTGLVQKVVVHAADIQDRDGARQLLASAKGFRPRLRLIWADGGYGGQLTGWVKKVCGWVLKIVGRHDDQTGFAVLPRRWVIERALALSDRYRRLGKNAEALPQISEALICAAMCDLMVRRVARQRQTIAPG